MSRNHTPARYTTPQRAPCEKFQPTSTSPDCSSGVTACVGFVPHCGFTNGAVVLLVEFIVWRCAPLGGAGVAGLLGDGPPTGVDNGRSTGGLGGALGLGAIVTSGDGVGAGVGGAVGGAVGIGVGVAGDGVGVGVGVGDGVGVGEGGFGVGVGVGVAVGEASATTDASAPPPPVNATNGTSTNATTNAILSSFIATASHAEATCTEER